MAELKEKFPKELEEWFKNQYPEFDAKLGVSQPNQPGQPEPKDDDNLTKWKEERRNIFEETFKEQLKSIESWKKRFNRKWHNRRRTVMDQQRKAAPVQLPPILIIDHPSRSDGRRLFEESNTEEFSKQATTLREAQGQCSKHHAGHWQAVAAVAWKGLTDEERDNFEQKAKITGSVKEGSIYENQKTVLLSLFQFLKSYQGTGTRQIGNSAFHLLYGFRGEADQLEFGSVEVSDHSFLDEKFSTFVGEYEGVVGGLWRQYCEKAIGLNCVVNYEATFNKSSAGWFILPEFDEENSTISALRSLLKVFMEASWDQIWPRSLNLPTLPWDTVLDHPTDFFNPLLSIKTILGHPDPMKAPALRDLSATIVAFQSSPPTLGFSIFSLKSNITNGLQQLGVRVKEGEAEEVENPDVTAPGSPGPVISTLSLPLLRKMPSSPSPQIIPASDPGPGLLSELLTNPTLSSSAPSPVPSSPHLSSVAVTAAAPEPSPPPISGTPETSASQIPSLVVPSRSPSSRSPISEFTVHRKIPLSASHFASIVISNNNLPTATSTVDSSTDTLPMTANTPGPKQKRKRYHNPVNENLLASCRSRKLSKRARGLGYDDSDEERQHPVGESSKRARVRRGPCAK